ncbi:hypothetical protein GCM10020000_10050 [Streptomyces olivoverticillatus]
MASTAQRPPTMARPEALAPISRAHSAVCVRVRWPPLRRGSPFILVALYTLCDSASMMPHSARDSGPNARDIVADLWSRSGASAAPAQIIAPTARTGQGIGWPAAATAAPKHSQAAAPDSECAGPIMVVPTPCVDRRRAFPTPGRPLSVTPE